MAIYVLSIGLNAVGEGANEPRRQLDDTLRATSAALGPARAVGMGRGEWNGVPERFVQIAVETDRDMIARRVGNLAAALRQEAIAVTLPDGGYWVLYHADGRDWVIGGPLSEFPIILDLEGV